MIEALYSDSELVKTLVLKGGNLLDLVFKISTRSSVDVDFSIETEFESVQALRLRMEAALPPTFKQAGYEVFDIKVEERPERLTENLRSFWGGYRLGSLSALPGDSILRWLGVPWKRYPSAKVVPAKQKNQPANREL